MGGNFKLGDEFIDGCPYDYVEPASWSVLRARKEAERGITPVSTGRARWLPTIYMDAVHFLDGVVAEIRARD